MKGGSHKKRDSGSGGGSNSKRSSAYGRDSASFASFHESSETTKQFNDRFDHLLVESIGSHVVVTVTSGVKYEGTLVAANFASTDGFDVILKYPRRVEGTIRSASDSTNDDSAGAASALAEDLGETFMIHAEDLAELELKDIDFSLDEKWEANKKQEMKDLKDTTESGRVTGEFKTDTDISRASNKIYERELQKWVPPEEEGLNDSSMAGQTLEESLSSWDQFATNEKKFGVKPTYDEHYYTTKINRDAPDFSERLRKAQELAEEIESQGSSGNIHIAEDRGHIIDDSGMDEEDLYSGVDRRGNELLASLKSNAKPSSNNKANKYVPPTLRNQPHHMDPAIISSTTAKNIVPVKNTSPPAASSALEKADTGTAKSKNLAPVSPTSPRATASSNKVEMKKASGDTTTSSTAAKKTTSSTSTEEPKGKEKSSEPEVAKEVKEAEKQKESKESRDSSEAKQPKETKQHELSPTKEGDTIESQPKEASKGPVSEDAKQRIREQLKSQLKQIKKQGGRRDYSAAKPKVSSTPAAPKQVQIEELKKFSQKFKVPYDVPKDMKDVLKKPSTVLRADPSLPPKPKFSVSPPRSANKQTSAGPSKSENRRLSVTSQGGGNQVASSLIPDKSNVFPKKRTPGSFFGPRKAQTGSNKKELYSKNFNFFLKAKEAHEEEKEMEPFLIEKPYFATPTWTGTVERSYRELLPDEQTLFHQAQARLHQRRMNSMSMAAMAATSGVGAAGMNPNMGIAMGIGGPGMVGFPITAMGAPGSEVGSPNPMMGNFATGSIGMYMPFQPQPMFYPSMTPMMPVMGDDSRGNPGTQGSSPQGASPHMPPAYMNLNMAGIPAYANVAGMIPFPGVMGGAMFGGAGYGQGYHNSGGSGSGSGNYSGGHERHSYHGGHHGHHHSESSGASGGTSNATGGSSGNNTSNSGGNVITDNKNS